MAPSYINGKINYIYLSIFQNSEMKEKKKTYNTKLLCP